MAKVEWVKYWYVKGSDPTPYKVAQAADGHFGCTCKRWIFCKAPKVDCHHIIGVKEAESTPWAEPVTEKTTFEIEAKVEGKGTERLYIRSIRKGVEL